tara:strand:- start:1363 stop:1491 length:129 start_codon:yes stop_codon:yes gene_type:complete
MKRVVKRLPLSPRARRARLVDRSIHVAVVAALIFISIIMGWR